MASNEEKADVDVGGWNQDRALAAISAGDTAEGLTATMAEILAAVGEGCFADPGAAAKPIIVAAKAKKNAGVWSVLAAQTFGTLLKALRNAPPPKSPSGSEGGSEEVVVNWEDAYAAGFISKLPEEFYKGRDGIHFHHTAGYGIVPGKSRGDEGNWNLEGTNGPAICAIWGEDGDTTLSFDSTARYVHFDFVNHEKSRPLKVSVRERESERERVRERGYSFRYVFPSAMYLPAVLPII